ncbi:SDR family oxidoreductase [Thiosulfativibrio zosterae]|uniref:NAD(P)-dependent oxidoreductase n=1 Tax=Thiosulfativibrio zosterae TaxID=2675053 RepID=A0A6F8PL89_9GAMM|nr:SDR family oxidoreductase [Thiosulfativibrio zosterae]BBP42871.1 NAD(P)-dependent oxidoreductase [Thiosulfativibrio zosterae]
MARVLIAGCGDIGCMLGNSLGAKGHEVFGLRRDISKISAPINPIAGDLFNLNTAIPQNLDYAFYIVSAASYKDFEYYQAYVLGLKNLIKALNGQSINRLFFISSTSVFGQSDGEWVTEESPSEGKNFSSNRILEGEALALNGPFPATVVRFGGIYGPGRTHLIDSVISGKAHCMEDVYSNRIHSEDCAAMLEHLMNLENPESLYIGVDNLPTLTCEVYDWLAEQLSVPDLEHKEPTENTRLLRSNKRLSNQKIRSTGYEFKYPTYQEGYAAILETLN